MTFESRAKSAVLIANERAGSGTALALSKRIQTETGITTIPFLSAIHAQTESELLEQFTAEQVVYAFVISGDGGALSFIQWLLEKQLTKKYVVTALGRGGENVVSKRTNTFAHPQDSVYQVLNGKTDSQLVIPQSVSVADKRAPFLWGVHGGVSADVLKHIEDTRVSKGNVSRRYSAVLRAVLEAKTSDPTLVRLNASEEEEVWDMGVISAAFPYWTSLFQLPQQPQAVATLQTLGAFDELQKNTASYIARLLLELTTLGTKLERFVERKILQHQPLYPGYTVAVTAPRLAVDSEVIPENSAVIKDDQTFPGYGNVFLTHIND